MIVDLELIDQADGSVTFNVVYSDYKTKGTAAYILAQELVDFIRRRGPGTNPTLYQQEPLGEA